MEITMTEKESTRYQYEPYPQINKPNNSCTNTLKRDDSAAPLKSVSVSGGSTAGGSTRKNRNRCCRCLSKNNTAFWASLLTNLGICTLLFAYTLLGSFIFLAIEGGASQMHQRTLASTINRQLSRPQPSQRTYEDLQSQTGAIEQALNDSRNRAVENIWDITVSLNILYRDNWTKLAALEIEKFQDELIQQFTKHMSIQLQLEAAGSGGIASNSPSTGAVMILPHRYGLQEYDWTFARAFLYSLTVLTTIGYGNIAPRTTLGRIVTLAYAMLGIPLTLIYLSSTGGVLAKVARGVFSKALCCCLCSNCGYCCYDEKRMAEKERRMKKKRQHEELRAQQIALQEPYYVRSGSLHNNLHSPEKQQHHNTIQIPEIDSLSTSESKVSMHGLSLLAPILLCLTMMIIYILFGAMVLYRLENWPLLDGIYFCFMSLSTIGFGDLVPGLKKESTSTLWFCSIYIMSGMALTAMCFNVLHQEIVHRIKHVVDINKKPINKEHDEQNDYLVS